MDRYWAENSKEQVAKDQVEQLTTHIQAVQRKIAFTLKKCVIQLSEGLPTANVYNQNGTQYSIYEVVFLCPCNNPGYGIHLLKSFNNFIL